MALGYADTGSDRDNIWPSGFAKAGLQPATLSAEDRTKRTEIFLDIFSRSNSTEMYSSAVLNILNETNSRL